MRNIQQSIYKAASIDSSKIAFSLDDKIHLSYGDLLSKAIKLANYISEQTDASSCKIGIMLPKCIMTPISIYGVLISTNIFVPIDPQLPIDRIEWILKECDIKILISDDVLDFKLKLIEKNVDCIIGWRGTKVKRSIGWETLFDKVYEGIKHIESAEEDVAYIMFTSGTTGKPKGIVHTHKSCLAYARMSKDLFEVNAEDSLVIHPPLHFDISTMGYFTMPLAMGHSIIMSDELTLFPIDTVKMLIKRKPTIWYSVPKAIYMLMDTDLFSEKDLPEIKHILYGGEPINKNYLKRLNESFSNATITNVYGPAEVNQCTYYFVPKDYSPPEEIPLGYVWEGASFLIEDAQNCECDKGELLISSSTMMKSYYNNDTLSNQSIVKRTKNGVTKKYYKTGDIVSLNHNNGLLYFHGRDDRQVKLNGYRIELDEIQNIANNYDSIVESVSTVIKADRTSYLALFYVSTKKITDLDLKRYLKSKLPTYAVPSLFQKIESIPRKTSGKVNYKGLTLDTKL